MRGKIKWSGRRGHPASGPQYRLVDIQSDVLNGAWSSSQGGGTIVLSINQLIIN